MSTGKKKRAFLAAYSETASITKAAELAGVTRDAHYKWLGSDSDYTAVFLEAKERAADVLEDEVIRRAHEGYLEPVFYKGVATGVKRMYSDTLLMFYLRAIRPQKYRDNGSVELSGADGGPLFPPPYLVIQAVAAPPKPEDEDH